MNGLCVKNLGGVQIIWMEYCDYCMRFDVVIFFCVMKKVFIVSCNFFCVLGIGSYYNFRIWLCMCWSFMQGKCLVVGVFLFSLDIEII